MFLHITHSGLPNLQPAASLSHTHNLSIGPIAAITLVLMEPIGNIRFHGSNIFSTKFALVGP